MKPRGEPEAIIAPAVSRDGTPAVNAEIRSIHQAAARLGVRLDDVTLVSRRRTGVYRTTVNADPSRARVDDRFRLGRSVQAARVVSIEDSITPTPVVHRVLYELQSAGAPVAGPLHPESVSASAGHVGFWDWLGDRCITVRRWGELTGAFHRAGRRLPIPLVTAVGAYDPAWVFGPRVRRVRELTAARGHPLYGAARLARRFEAALELAARAATLAAERQGRPCLVVGDNQPGNVLTGPRGPVLNDAERLAVGAVAVDLAPLLLGMQHYGYPASVADEFLDGYGAQAPRLEDARPFARIRELSGVVLAMIGADAGPEAEHEMHVRTRSIAAPGEGEPWTYLGRPDATHLAGRPSNDPRHDCTTNHSPDACRNGIAT